MAEAKDFKFSAHTLNEDYAVCTYKTSSTGPNLSHVTSSNFGMAAKAIMACSFRGAGNEC